MLKTIIFSFFVACYFVYVTCFGIIALGKWEVLNIRRCPDDDQYRIKYDIRRKKLNRTADGFDLFVYLSETIDHTYGIWIDVCVHVDGGCKPFQVLTDNSFEGFLKRHARENFDRAMKMFGLIPPDFPIKPGNFGLHNYIFDVAELPKAGVIGKYSAMAYLMKNKQKVTCVEVTIDFIVNENYHIRNESYLGT